MEQKRILWIVAAVGLFLLVVVGFALILYSPAQKQDPIITSNQSTNDIWTTPQNATPLNPNYQANSLQGTPLENTILPDSNQMANIPQGITQNPSQVLPGQYPPGQVPPHQQVPQMPQGNGILPSDSMALVGQQKVQDVTLISENTKVITSGGTTIDLTGLTVNSSTQPVVTQNTNANAQTTVAKTSTKVTSPAKTETTKVASSTKAASTKTANKSATTAKSSASTTTVSVPKYWIQAGSYSSKKNAEEARSALSSEKIASEIFTFTDTNGTLFYRVRVGPYTTKSEAEYWQSRIALIEKFSSTKTYITDSSAKKQ